jgi:hypothetical protein
MNKGKIFTLTTPYSRSLMHLLFAILLSGCIATEMPADAGSNSEPSIPRAVERMESLGYDFIYHAGDDPYWETENSTQGWTFRIWEDGSFGMGGQFEKDFQAQTEASIDFFQSLDVSPEQASFTNQITLDALTSTSGEATGCDKGLCCNAQVVESEEFYLWICEFE